MWYVGIDPGAKGAICLLNPATGESKFRPTPGPTYPAIEAYNWLKKHQIDHENRIRIIGVEQVSSVQGAGAGSNFKFGYNVGAVNTLAEITCIGVDAVRPKEWQKKVGVSVPQKLKGTARKRAIKEAIAAVSLRLYPTADILGPKGGLLDGRSDALMIAHYMCLKYEGGL